MRRASIFVLCAAAAACSSNKDDGSTTPSNDGGAATSTDGGTTASTDGGTLPSDGATTDDGGPTDAGTADPAACEAVIAYTQRCATDPAEKSAQCGADLRAQCGQYIAATSPAYAAALVKCDTPAVDCTDGPGECLQTEMTPASTTPSAAQIRVRDLFCATCGGGSPTCADDYFKITIDGAGPGFEILEMADAPANEVADTCTAAKLSFDAGDTAGCAESFSECADAVFSAHQGEEPSTCYTDTSD